MNILLINYGTSNIRSIYNSIVKIKKVKIRINDFNFKYYDKIIFPGQGHIKLTIDFINSIKNFFEIIKNKYILGICIGYHLFFNNSEEDNSIKSLGIINDSIKKIYCNCCYNNSPSHIGWNNISILKNHKLFKNIPNNFNQYFMHSYSSIYNNQVYSFGISKFNNLKFNSIIIFKNKILFQFHPEKSGQLGLKLIKNFLEL